MEFTEYISIEGDRPDLIAFKIYGSFYLYPQIIMNNPIIINKPILDSGIVLLIPAPSLSNMTIDKNLLPPWKR